MYNYVLQFSNGAVVKLSSVLYISNWAYLYNTFYILSFKKFKIDSNCLFSFFCCRILLAVLLKHHDLGHAALAIVEQGDHSKHSVPKSISELFKVVSKTKRSLIQVFHLHVLNEWIDCTLSLQKFDSLNVHNIKWIYNAIVKKDWVFGNFYHCLERFFYFEKIKSTGSSRA